MRSDRHVGFKIWAIALVISGLTGSAFADTATWIGSSGSYSDTLNWDVTEPPCNGLTSYDVVIPASAGTITLDVANCTVDSFTLGESSAFRLLSGNDMQVASNAVIAGLIDSDGGDFIAPAASFSGNRATINASAGGVVHLGATSYSTAGLADNNYAPLFATGGGTRIELPLLTSLDTGFDDGVAGVKYHRVVALSGAVIDLSAVTSLVPPAQPTDYLWINSAGGSIELTSLLGVSGVGGYTVFETSLASALSLPAVQTLDDVFFKAASASTISVNGPQGVAITTSGYNVGSATVINAAGAGTTIDLSAVTSLDLGFDDGVGAARWHRILSSTSANVDLSNLTGLTLPVGQTDYLWIQANGGGIDLSSLASFPSAGGYTVIDSSGASSLAFPSAASLGDLLLVASAGGDILFNGPQPLTFSSAAFSDGSYSVINASGAGTVIDLSAVTQLDLSFDDGSAAVKWHRLLSQSGAVIDLPAVTTLVVPVQPTDYAWFHGFGGTINLPLLTKFPAAGGYSFVEAGNGANLSFPAMQQIEDLTIAASGGSTVLFNGPQPISFSTTQFNTGSVTIVSASGAGTVVDLSSVTSLDFGFDDASVSQRWHRLLASSDSLIDLSGITSYTLPVQRTDYAWFHSNGGTIDLGSLSEFPTAGGYTVVQAAGSVASFPSLGAAGDVAFVASGGATIELNGAQPITWDTTDFDWVSLDLVNATGAGTVVDLSSVVTLRATFDDGVSAVKWHRLISQFGASIDLSGLGTIELPVQSTDYLDFYLNGGAIDLSAIVDFPDTGGYTVLDVHSGSTLSLPSVESLRDVVFDVDGGSSMLITGPMPVTYSSVNFNAGSTNLVDASGSSTLCDFSSIVSLDLGFDDGAAASRYHRILANGGSTIDLSGVTSITTPIQQTDYVWMHALGGGAITLDSLPQLSGLGGYTFLDADSGSTISLAAVERLEEVGFEATAGGSILVNGPQPVTLDNSGLNWTSFNIVNAAGADTLIDLSSVTRLDSGFDHAGAGVIWQRVLAASGSRIDLSGVEQLTSPARAEDYLWFHGVTGTIVIDGVRGTGGTGYFRLHSTSSAELQIGSFPVTVPTFLDAETGGTISAVDIIDDPATVSGSEISITGVSSRLALSGTLDLADDITLDTSSPSTISIGRDLRHAFSTPIDVDIEPAILHFDGIAAQRLEVASTDNGPARPAGDAFAVGQVIVGQPGETGTATVLQLVDLIENAGGSPEAIYLTGLTQGPVDRRGLVIEKDSTLSLGCLNAYVFDDDTDATGELLNDRFSGDQIRVFYDQGFLQLDADTDGDLLVDCLDNCPRTSNPDQTDTNFDGIGDACDQSIPLDDPSLSEMAEGLGEDAGTGSSLDSAGDLDQDGLRDFIAGSPSYTHSGLTAAGAASVYLGSANAAERTTPDIVFVGEAAHDRAGTSVAGNFDFDGDGTPDLLIGAEQLDRSGSPLATGAGKVYLIYFDPGDYPNLADPGVTDTIDLARVGVDIAGVVFTGVATGDRLGFAVDGGGRMNPGAGQDIVLGAPGADPVGRTDAGSSYVIFDDPTLTGNVSLTRVASGLADEIDGVVFLGEAVDDELGAAVSFPGDVIGTTGDDVALGAPGRTAGAFTAAGVVYVAAAGDFMRDITEVCDVGDEKDDNPNAKTGVRINGTQSGERLGSSIAGGGDNLFDGEHDLLIGAPLFDAGSVLDVGRVIQSATRLPLGVLDADRIGAPANDPLSVPGAIWVGRSAGDQLGTAVAGVGDLTGDGIDDIALGAPLADVETESDAGIVYLQPGGVPATLDQGVIDLSRGFGGTQLLGRQAGERAGTALAGVGDFDGDGDEDLIVGAPGRDSMSLVDVGRLYLVLGIPCPDADVDGDGVMDCLDNCPAESNSTQTDQDRDGRGDVCDNCVDTFNPDQLNQDLDAFGSVCDNCEFNPNDSQLDRDADGAGDACDTNPIFRVSVDASENADFMTLQDAIDNARETGTRIEIVSDMTCHAGVVVDRGQVFRLVGVDRDLDGDGTFEQACVDGNLGDGATGIAFDVRSSFGSFPVQIHNLTLRGDIGLRTLVATDLRQLFLDDVTSIGLDFDGGDHVVEDLSIVGGFGDGIDVATGVGLELTRSRIEGLPTGSGVVTAGSTRLENVLIATSSTAISQTDGTLELSHSTVADGEVGINRAFGTSTIAYTLFWNNSSGDLLGSGLSCSTASWSNLCAPDCSGQNDNVCSDPLFEAGGYGLSAISPLLEFGPDPILMAGDPCFDIVGGPRLRDHDGDGLARVDVGAYERETPSTPPEVTHLVWLDKQNLSWDPQPGLNFHAYRDEVSLLGYGFLGTPRDELIPGASASSLVDFDEPAPGVAWFYLISADDNGEEGTIGLATCAERCNATICH